jgi:hypothetical protein
VVLYFYALKIQSQMTPLHSDSICEHGNETTTEADNDFKDAGNDGALGDF